MTHTDNAEELLNEAWTQRRKGNYEDGKRLVERAQLLIKEGDYNSLGRVFHIYAQFESDHDNNLKALEFLQWSLEFYEKSGNSDKIAHSTRHIADVRYALGEESDSENNYRKAASIYKTNSRTYEGDLANALAGYAQILEKRKKISEAIIAWEETKDLYQACNLESGVQVANNKLSSLSRLT